ncbi:MAG TPA: 3-hydroxyacyl-CoA dehydrogenase NAD-binding domain-containing protein [Candidatus Methylomirabilis sp.]|nr:3-hydroxyacyl-CoA dehydrogenase NAD-binding domain-containing protein [Candidatus Methylomirabilis sp.]
MGASVAVIGAGRMGPGIALAFAAGGCPVLLVGRGAPQLQLAQAAFDEALAGLAQHNLLDADSARASAGRFQLTTDLAKIGASQVVIEATPEALDSKQELLAEMETRVGPETILASNTSGLPITRIAACTRRPRRVVGMKFVNPAHLVPLVEVVKGEATAREIVTQACVLLRQIGKRPVAVMRDVPGFLNNRIQQAMRREAISLVARGIASAEDVDAAVRWGFGFRLLGAGTLETMDLVGLGQILKIHEYIIPDLEASPEPSPLLRELVARGDTGARAGRGFLTWDEERERAARARMDALLIEGLKLARRWEGGEATPAAESA